MKSFQRFLPQQLPLSTTIPRPTLWAETKSLVGLDKRQLLPPPKSPIFVFLDFSVQDSSSSRQFTFEANLAAR
jgi:hypothetical protein